MLHWDGTPVEALLLDLDDTLLDNGAGLEQVWREVSHFLTARLGDVDVTTLIAQVRVSSEWFWSDDERQRTGRLDMTGSRRALLTHALEAVGRPAPALADEAATLYSELRDASLAPFAGALDALARVRACVPSLGLVTNGAAEAQRAKIERFDLARFFDVIVVEGEAGFGKPDRRVFENALAAVSVPGERALMAGDNYHCDVLGALDAGLHAVWIDRRQRGATPAPAPRPHRTLPSFVRLVEEMGIDNG